MVIWSRQPRLEIRELKIRPEFVGIVLTHVTAPTLSKFSTLVMTQHLFLHERSLLVPGILNKQAYVVIWPNEFYLCVIFSADETDTGHKRPHRNGSAGKANIPNYYTKHSPGFNKMQLPLDEDDYLQPKSSKPRAYADLIDGQGKTLDLHTGIYTIISVT